MTTRPKKPTPEDYRSSVLELLGLSSPYEHAITQVRNDVVVTPPSPSQEEDTLFPSIDEVPRGLPTDEEVGNAGLVQRLWRASEAADQDLIIEDWGPQTPIDRGVGRYRWAWWPVLLGALVIGIVLLITNLRGIPASQADDLRGDWAASVLDVRANLPSAREATVVITSAGSDAALLSGARNSLIGFGTSATALDGVVSRDFPTPPPLASGSAFDELKPVQGDLLSAADLVSQIEKTLSDAITYRALLDQSFLLPSLPVVADEVVLTDLGIQLAAVVSSTRASVRQLPIGPSFDPHRNRALALVNRLETWQASYLDALRLSDGDAATELKTEITGRISTLRGTVTEPLTLVATAASTSLDRLDLLLEEALADLGVSF